MSLRPPLPCQRGSRASPRCGRVSDTSSCLSNFISFNFIALQLGVSPCAQDPVGGNVCCWQRCLGGEVVWPWQLLLIPPKMEPKWNPPSLPRPPPRWVEAGSRWGSQPCKQSHGEAQSFEHGGGGRKNTKKSTRGCARPEAAALRWGSSVPPGAAIPRLWAQRAASRGHGVLVAAGSSGTVLRGSPPVLPRAAPRQHLGFGAGRVEVPRGRGFPPSRGFVTESDNIKSGCLNIAPCFLTHLSLSLQLRFHWEALPAALPSLRTPCPWGWLRAALGRQHQLQSGAACKVCAGPQPEPAVRTGMGSGPGLPPERPAAGAAAGTNLPLRAAARPRRAPRGQQRWGCSPHVGQRPALPPFTGSTGNQSSPSQRKHLSQE